MNNKPNLAEIMEAAQKMQQNMKQAQQELGKVEETGESGGGTVSIRVNGLRQVLAIRIDPSLLNEEVEVLEALLVSAFNEALKKVEKRTEEKVMDLAKGFKLPGNLTSDEEGSSS